MPKLRTAQKPFTILVANLREGSDPSKGASGNPTKLRTGFTMQHVPEVSRGQVGGQVARHGDPSTPGVTTHMGLLSGDPSGGIGTITVASNTFTTASKLYIGPYTVTSGEDFTVGGSTALTAAALATAINNLPGVTASDSGSDVTVTIAQGLQSDQVRFEAYHPTTTTNYTLVPTTGYFAAGSPSLGAPTILT